MSAATALAPADCILVVNASASCAQTRRVAMSATAANQELDTGAPPRAIVIEAHERTDELERLWWWLSEAGLAGAAPTLLAAPLDLVRALAGAPVDDFVVAPWGLDEIVERVRRIEQRHAERPPFARRIGTLELDPGTHRVAVGRRTVALTRLEFALLTHFVNHPSQVLTRTQLLAEVWGDTGTIGSRTIDIHVRRLRAKLGVGAAPLTTVRGVGYCFVA